MYASRGTAICVKYIASDMSRSVESRRTSNRSVGSMFANGRGQIRDAPLAFVNPSL